MNKTVQLLINGFWLIFVVWWIVAAFGQKAVAERQSRGSWTAHRVPVTLGTVLLFFGKFPPPLGFRLTPQADWLLLFGAVVCGLGLAFAIWARLTLAGNWSSNVTFKQSHELITSGPYHFVRHPIYTGLLLMVTGTAIARGDLCYWLGTLLWAIGFWIKLKQEESVMLAHFPGEYPGYSARVKALVPFLL